MTNLMVNSQVCSGCRMCEIMCTFHHQGVFGRRASSIRVRRIERAGEFEIIVYRDDMGGHLACDLCNGAEQPLCVKFCHLGALSMQESGM